MRVCSKCKKEKESTEFRARKNKISYQCAECERIADRERYVAKKATTNIRPVVPLLLPTPPTRAIVQDIELPEPDQLPAPYVKRVYEMWKSLIGETNSGTRIA